MSNPAAAPEDAPQPLQAVLTRTGEPSVPLTVALSIDGSATLGEDYILGGATVGSVVFPIGARSVTIFLQTVVDNLVEGDETVVISLLDGNGYALVKGQADVTATLSERRLCARRQRRSDLLDPRRQCPPSRCRSRCASK